jgi:microcystin-dependent protein
MSDPFIGEIRIFSCTFAPYGFLDCNGQSLPIAPYQPLFAVIGTQYGGNGTTTFNLPNLADLAPIGFGISAQFGTNYALNGTGGVDKVTLTTATMPAHTHAPNACSDAPGSDPIGSVWGSTSGRPAPAVYTTTRTAPKSMNPAAVLAVGGGGEHNNLMPYLPLHLCIAYIGVFPVRP